MLLLHRLRTIYHMFSASQSFRTTMHMCEGGNGSCLFGRVSSSSGLFLARSGVCQTHLVLFVGTQQLSRLRIRLWIRDDDAAGRHALLRDKLGCPLYVAFSMFVIFVELFRPINRGH